MATKPNKTTSKKTTASKKKPASKTAVKTPPGSQAQKAGHCRPICARPSRGADHTVLFYRGYGLFRFGRTAGAARPIRRWGVHHPLLPAHHRRILETRPHQQIQRVKIRALLRKLGVRLHPHPNADRHSRSARVLAARGHEFRQGILCKRPVADRRRRYRRHGGNGVRILYRLLGVGHPFRSPGFDFVPLRLRNDAGSDDQADREPVPRPSAAVGHRRPRRTRRLLPPPGSPSGP